MQLYQAILLSVMMSITCSEVMVVTAQQKAPTIAHPRHKQTMKRFFSENPSYVPLTWFDEDTLTAMRNEWGFGRNFTPYYATGDFNGDEQGDFAIILAIDTGNGLDPHVLVFNGTNGGKFYLAYNERENPDKGLFLRTYSAGGKRKRLYVGIAESDSAGCFEPRRRGYVQKPCGNR